MDTVLQEKLAEIIELGQVGVLKAVEILKEQAPELIRQFMAFETFSASVGVFFGVVLLGVTSLLLLYLKKKEWNLDGTPEFVAGLIGMFTGGFGIGLTLSYGFILAKIILAPNLYIIQHLLTVLK